MVRRIALLSTLVLGMATVACGPSSPGTNSGWNQNNTNGNNNSTSCEEGQTRCDMTGTAVEVCVNETWTTQNLCSGDTPFCFNAQCVVCQPNTRYCQGNQVMQCNADGNSGTSVETCEAGTTCTAGSCVSPCQIAEQQKSYIGCDYWPTPVANTSLDEAFENDFAVVVHNDNEQQVTVTIEKGGSQVAQEQVAPGELKTIELPYDSTLKGSFDNSTGQYNWPATSATAGAYHLTSTMPVTVYQFNPLNFELNRACVSHKDDMGQLENPCHSYTNDAALLLPTHVLSTHYMIMSRPSFGVGIDQGFGFQYSYIPGYFSVVATQDNTVVTISFTAHTLAGGGLQTYNPGDTAQFQLNRGQVLQILSDTNGSPTSCAGQETSDDCNGQGQGMYTCHYCDQGAQYDLTGTAIEASAPVAVFSGHVCDFVPFNYWACDHLEEQMIPSEAWGSDYIVARTEPQSPGNPEPNVIKIVSREDGNQLTFDPPAVHDNVTLNAGESITFTSDANFRVTGTQPLMVAQFLVGQNYYTNDTEYWGDPAFALVVPFEQYRGSYTFLTPSTITYNYVNVIARVGEDGQNVGNVTLDGQLLNFQHGRVGQYGIARVNLSSSANSAHVIEGSEPFGIMVYGFARYTSYFYPGGLNLEFINPVE